MRQNIICHIIGEQELSLPPDAMSIPPPLLPCGKKQEICQPPANNITLNFLTHNTCMLLNRMMY